MWLISAVFSPVTLTSNESGQLLHTFSQNIKADNHLNARNDSFPSTGLMCSVYTRPTAGGAVRSLELKDNASHISS